MLERTLRPVIAEDLQERMVFLGGPRQVGKTTLAASLMESRANALYLSWDRQSHRRRILDGDWSAETTLLVLDELHKKTGWKNLIKGYWDTRPPGQQILVTGSARLDVFRRGGDSLLGRYRYHRLHPVTVAELARTPLPLDDAWSSAPPRLHFERKSADAFTTLLRFGGFPEPLSRQRTRTLKRWQLERFERVFREDIRSTEMVQALSQLELLGELLPARVGSPFSLQSLAEDVEVAPKTVKSWLALLARNYFCFSVPPYHQRIERALKKESKTYLWDWSVVEDPAARFENLIASHLLKLCHYAHDAFGSKVELHYVRDREKREVDFLVTWEKKPWLLVEAKLGARTDSGHVARFAEALGVRERYVVVSEPECDRFDRMGAVRILSADRFLGALV